MSREQAAFAWWFGWHRQPALCAMLAALFLARGGAVRFDPAAPARIAVCRIRSAMSGEAIDTTPAGYNLTERGLTECETALSRFGEWAMGRAA